MKIVENLLLVLNFHCWYVLKWLLWEFGLT